MDQAPGFDSVDKVMHGLIHVFPRISQDRVRLPTMFQPTDRYRASPAETWRGRR